MTDRLQPGRIVQAPASAVATAADDDRVVLRLAREPLRQDPPAVRFIGRSGPAPQGALPWLAYD